MPSFGQAYVHRWHAVVSILLTVLDSIKKKQEPDFKNLSFHFFKLKFVSHEDFLLALNTKQGLFSRGSMEASMN